MSYIRVEPTIAAFPNTYIFATARFTVTIFNDGPEKVCLNVFKYENLTKEKEALSKIDRQDPQQRSLYYSEPYFISENFRFEETEFEIWPSKSRQITVGFTPQIAETYKEIAYFGEKGKENRFPLVLRGTGLPPDASFNVDSINVGHIALDNTVLYKVVLRNTGQVGVDFELEKKQKTSQIFKFSPYKGHINVGEEINISVEFVANSVGSFSEEFKFNIRGATHNFPTLTIYGRVLGPTFSVNTKNIVFGTVSYGFLYEQSFEIENKSEIPFDYTLELDYDGKFERREFAITPFTGTIGKFAKQVVKVEFIPVSIQEYNVQLYLNVSKYDEKLYKINITGKSICPQLSLVSDVVNMGSIFIGSKYTGKIQIVDDTDYPSKFEYQESTDSSKMQANIEVPKPVCVTKPHTTTDFEFTLTPNQLGPLNLVKYLKLSGNHASPIPFTITGICTGPNIVISSKQIIFKQISVLKKYQQTVTIKNDSTIKASFHNSIKCDNSEFSLSQYEGEIEPGDSLDLIVTAFLDDPSTFKGVATLYFDNLTPINIDIEATGVGTTIKPNIDMSTINYGYIFADRPNDLSFTLTNKGRKPQEIRFSQTKPKIDEKAKFSFKITPEQAVIESHETVDFKFTVMCNKVGSFYIDLQIASQIGKSRQDLFKPKLKGTFVKPMIAFSKQTIEFKHLHDFKKEEHILLGEGSLYPSRELLTPVEEPLTITNNSKLPLTFYLSCPEPFRITQEEFSLEPLESKELSVLFNTLFKTDFSTETIIKKLIVTLGGLPQKLGVNLKGTIVFPNLEFNPSTPIDFGSMLMNTEQTKDIELSNPTDLPVVLEWELLASKTLTDDISKIFDVYPTRATIPPHSTDMTHISFYAKGNPNAANAFYEGTAICHIEGGPEYSIPIKGGSANICYQIEPNNISFGDVNYNKPLQTTVNFTNTSKVPINYTIKIPKACHFNSIAFTPSDGQIEAGETIKIDVNIITGLPIQYSEQFFIQIGHFEEYRIDIDVNCFIPHLQFNIPRNEDDPVRDVFKSRRILRNYPFKEETPEVLERIETELLINQLSQPSVTSVRKRRKRENKESNEYDGFVLNAYDFDLGTIVFGRKETFNLKLKSTSCFPISFDIDTRALANTGFTVETSSFVDIPPNEEVDVTLNFLATKKSYNLIGDIVLPMPIVMNNDFATMVNIKVNLQMPVINFSKTHFDFGNVIAGQTLVLTLQLQNMNSVPCEFNLGEAEFVNVLHRSMQQGVPPPFTACPSSGILPPSSFMNIEIAFSPKNDKTYSMQFPVEVKHNTRPFLVTLKGTGVQLKVLFDPPDLKMPPVLPFSEPSEAEVKLINPTQYPIEVMALQFDLQLYVDSLEKAQLTASQAQLPKPEPESNINFINQNTVASKFSICVIVNGANGTGKTTVCQALSKYLKVPIINLADVWKDLIEKQDATREDFIEGFQSIIRQPEYFNGFIIDGLKALNEPQDTEQFLMHCIKGKNAIDEVLKNPYNTYQHTTLTSTEQALDYVLASLDGHYVFHVGLRASDDVIAARNEVKERKIQEEKRKQLIQEKEELFSMTEEEYEKLSPEKQEEIDAKRQAYRRRMIRTALESTPDSGRSTHSKHKHKHHSKDSKKDGKKSDKKDSKKDSKSSKKDEEEKKEVQESPKKRGKGLPTDPYQYSRIHFLFTFGSIAQKLRESADNFTFVDPMEIFKDEKEEQEDEKVKVVEEEETEEEKIEINNIKNVNTILVDVINKVENVNKEVIKFIPQSTQLENKAFTCLIPQPRLILTDPETCKQKIAQMPKFFSIVVEEDAQEESRIFMDSRPTTKQKSGRKSRTSKARDYSSDLDVDISKNTPRWSIEPNSEKVITILFNPQNIGSYSDTILFALANAKSDTFKLPVSGSCLYPDIDRSLKSIWPKSVPRFEPKCEPTFIIDRNEYSFGSILVSKEKPVKASYAYHGTAKIRNITPFPTEVTANLVDHSGKNCFQIETPSFTVQPESEFLFQFGFHPTIPDQYKADIDFFVKDNPEPISFGISADACIPILELSGTSFDFEKQLLSQSRTLKIDLKNTGKLPAYWRLKNVQQVTENLTFNQTEGMINPRGSFSIVSVFSSDKPYAIKKTLALEVYDKDKTRIFQTNNIQVMAEAFDVNVDFQYPKGLEHLVYGPMKVSQPKTLSCTLTNKGRYTSGFKVIIAQKAIEKCFEVMPMEGQIPSGNKQIQINFTFMSNKIVTYNSMKGITIKLTDALTNTNTGEIPVLFSATTLYNTFKIDPIKKLDFGSIQVNTSEAQKFTITNTGVFPFDYDIQGKVEEVDKTPQAKKAPKGQKAPPKAKRKVGDKTIIIGPYSLGPSSGQILPDTSATIDVEFISNVPGNFNSTALISITGINPSHNNGGIPFMLKASSFLPGILTNKYEKIFPSLPLCLAFERPKLTRNAFIEDEQILFFSPMVLQTKSTVEVCLVNPISIPCTVDITIKPKQKSSGQFPFDISEKTVSIGPDSSKSINITFAPTACDKFVAIFEANVRSATEPDKKTLRFIVEGAGTLPMITAVGLEKSGKSANIPINLGKTLVGFRKEKDIFLKNEGLIPTKVMINAKPTPDFELLDIDSSTEFVIEPERQFQLKAVFCPQKVRKGSFEISVTVVDNPKANLNFIISAEGFSEDIIFENVRGEDELVFNDNVVGRQQTATFVMHNVSTNDIKFKWGTHPDFVFSPAVGHLRVNQTKEITVTFFSTKAVKHNATKVVCQWTKIKLDSLGAPDWDDSMKMLKYVPKSTLTVAQPQPVEESPTKNAKKNKNSKKHEKNRRPSQAPSSPQNQPPQTPPSDEPDVLVRVVDVKPEPKYTEIPGKYKDLVIKIFAISDFIRYVCDTTDIAFASTMMYETRTSECKISNPTQIRFEYVWKIMNFKSLRSDYSSIRGYPFHIMPQTGFIEPGQTTTFKIQFKPEEVDDFTAQLTCQIPFITQSEPPVINISGLSRRPLCHFNIKMSDYVSAGRRHPDYTYELPPGTHVIEAFAPKPGQKTNIKFEIINPTGTPYEVVWKRSPGPDTEVSSAITCESPSALISSGKRYFVNFSFLPTSQKLVESLWEFSIPEHNATTFLLIVGRIAPQ